MQFLGFVSYPLYLINENMMVSIVIKLSKVQAVFPLVLLPALAMVFLIYLAFPLAKYVEPWVRRPLAVWTSTLCVARA